MRALALVLGLAAGAAVLGFVCFAQLIFAQSEGGYYSQLALAVGILTGFFLYGRKASVGLLGGLVLVSSFLTASMPIDSRLMAISSTVSRRVHEPPIDLEGAPSLSDQLMGLGLGWLMHMILLGVFAFGLRYWATNGRRKSEGL
jgi:hypothetical protein